MSDRYNAVPQMRDDRGKRVYASTYLSSIPEQDNDIYIITRDRDRLDQIASNFYEDVTLWWIIALANGMNDMMVPPGTKLRIPVNTTEILSSLERTQTSG